MMKNHLFVALACVGMSALLSGCGGSSNGVSATVDPKVLENKEEVQKIYDAIVKVMGAQASKADEIMITINNPADKGKTGDTYLMLLADMQDPDNPKQLIRQQFYGPSNSWLPLRQVTVEASDDKENFRLENELFDFTKISADKLFSVIQQAYNKNNADPQKFTYRYVQRVNISINGYQIDVEGKLKSNDQIISDYVNFDLDGNMEK